MKTTARQTKNLLTCQLSSVALEFCYCFALLCICKATEWQRMEQSARPRARAHTRGKWYVGCLLDWYAWFTMGTKWICKKNSLLDRKCQYNNKRKQWRFQLQVTKIVRERESGRRGWTPFLNKRKMIAVK